MLFGFTMVIAFLSATVFLATTGHWVFATFCLFLVGGLRVRVGNASEHVILVRRYGDVFRADLQGDSICWDRGNSAHAAIGAFIMTHGHKLGISVVETIIGRVNSH